MATRSASSRRRCAASPLPPPRSPSWRYSHEENRLKANGLFDLTGKTAMVIGAASGIGEAVALRGGPQGGTGARPGPKTDPPPGSGGSGTRHTAAGPAAVG